jgi:hypothetical protein
MGNQTRGVVLWRGASVLGGSPIAMVATFGTSNRKTGGAVQTWIIRTDVSPADAVKSGADFAVCGDCPQRHFLGGHCYVLPFQSPGAVYRALMRGSYDADHGRALSRFRALLASGAKLRLGAYGDPAAVPLDVYDRIMPHAVGGWLGYTHQWRATSAQFLREYCMASVDNAAEESQARAMGWRTFRAMGPGETIGERTIECLSESRGTTCQDCGICDGARAVREIPGSVAVSVWIQTHGARAKRSPSLAVVR